MAASSVTRAKDSAIREHERQRITRELHNSTAQLLVALQLQLAELRRSTPLINDALLQDMCQVVSEIHNSIKQVAEPQRDQDENRAAQIAVAKVFHSLGNFDGSD